MMSKIEENIKKITKQLPVDVRLVAVSKYHPIEKLMEAYAAGQRLFGENHVQELVFKAPQMPTDVKWQFIGHLQTNKVRMLMPHVAMIQSIDSMKLLKTVNKEAARINRSVDALIQLHVAQEETKSGFSIEELVQEFEQGAFEGFDHVRICGLMAMATNTTNRHLVAQEFHKVKEIFNLLKDKYFTNAPHFKELSMGMSQDWPLAVQEGATLVRIGTDIFGEREY